MLDPVTVGMVIQRIREQKKQSQELVSGFAGIGRTHLSAIERGERKPTLETFFKIADALNIKPSSLMAAIEEELDKQNNKKK
ncbi:MAG: helix-turn-helix transcriptional regulator [Oscillospiraceae bacterium]|nr:helix-turn-helix transcriptional regulator [Oscillospiraceae bacterium]